MSSRRRKERGAVGAPPEHTLRVVRALVGGGAAVSLALCPQVWLAGRAFPTAPILEALPVIGRPFDGMLYAALLVAAAASALVPARHAMKAAGTLLGLVVLLVPFDQNRFQPWLYLYLVLLLVAALGESRVLSRGAAERGLLTCLLLAACTYLWSGIHKTNGGFANETFPWLLDAFLEQATSTKVAPLGWVLGPVEAALGLGLLFARTRRPSAIGIVLMHGAILLAVGPLGHDWNAVVWPWNIVMSALVLVLAWRTEGRGARDVLALRGQVLRPVLLVLFGVMPAFALVDLWDDYLSSALYAGNELRGEAELPPRILALLPAEVRALADPLPSGGHAVNLTSWATIELGVPPYPARRVMLQVQRRLCALALPGEQVALRLQERPDCLTGVHPAPARLSCSQER